MESKNRAIAIVILVILGIILINPAFWAILWQSIVYIFILSAFMGPFLLIPIALIFVAGWFVVVQIGLLIKTAITGKWER